MCPSGDVAVAGLTDQTFDIAALPGYEIADVVVDGTSRGPRSSYTFSDVVADGSIAASFALDTFTITASAGAGGTIDPSGDVAVDGLTDQTFDIAALPGYEIADVVVDGTSRGPLSSYTFSDVVADGSIAASFALDTFTITASAGAGGTIDPSGDVAVAALTDQTFDIAARPGYEIADVVVDGTSRGPLSSYTFSDVVADGSIAASFALDTFTITASAGAGGTIDPSGD